ncbi:MAG: ATP-dependent zinc protease [Lachnospiraceae bacterium]|nr:ATP-dependent zinc protease [Lachnospiraceae bacterium]
MVIGVEEPILIKGIGEIIAKVDSGNSGYNVIHGEELIIQGDILTFKTENKDGKERRVSKKIKDTINVNIGGGHIQERPVIELNVQFGGQDYKKVLFSVTNRKDNEHKVLLSKDFVGKELEALIDVTQDNIADDNVNVDYVTEGIGSALADAKNAINKTTSALMHGTKASKASYEQAVKNRKAMWGEETSPDERKRIDPKLKDEVDALSKLAEQLKADAELIRKQLPTQKEKEVLVDLDVEVSGENIDVFKILDYTGGTNKSEDDNGNKEFQERLKKALEAWKTYARETKAETAKREAKDEAEERIVKEATEQPQQPADNTTTTTSTEQPSSNEDKSEDKNQTDPTKEVQGAENEKDIADMKPEEVEAVLKELQARNRAIFYLICFKKSGETELKSGKDVIGAIQTDIDSWNKKICAGKDWSRGVFEPFAKMLAEKVKEDGKGLFALCTQPANQRKVEFFIDPGVYDGHGESVAQSKKETQVIEKYKELNEEFKKMSGKDLSEETWIQYSAKIVGGHYKALLDFIKMSNAFKYYLKHDTPGEEDANIEQPENFTMDSFEHWLANKPNVTLPSIATN